MTDDVVRSIDPKQVRRTGPEVPLSPGIGLVLSVTAVVTLASYGLLLATGWLLEVYHHGTSEFTLAAFCRLDCDWYRSIASGGYHEFPTGHATMDAANWAFWPLFPIVVRLIINGLDLEFSTAGFLVNFCSNTIFIALFLRYHRYFLSTFREAVLFICLFQASPFHFYLQVPYTESLFALLLLVSAIGWQANAYGVSAIAGLGLTALRANGIFWPLSLALAMLPRHRFSILALVDQNFGRILTIAAMPLGTVAYLAYLGWFTGDPLAFLHTQIAWNRGFENFSHKILKILRPDSAIQIYWSYGGMVAIPFIYYLYKNDKWKVFSLFIAMTMLVSYMTKIDSITRYIWTLFPLYFVFLKLKIEYNIILIGLMVLLKIVFIVSWLSGAVWMI